MPANINKNEELGTSRQKTWNWLRLLPAYVTDYQRQCQGVKSGQLKKEERGLLNDFLEFELKMRWGFFPLEDPGKTDPPRKLYEFLNKILAQGKTGYSIRPLNISWLQLWFYGKPPKKPIVALPNKPYFLEVEIDYTRSIEDIKKDIAYLVTQFRRAYGLSETRKDSIEPATLYQSFVCRNLKIRPKDMESLITLPNYDSEAKRKRVLRTRKKLSKILGQKP